MKKIFVIDLMRAASILYIVGFWHLMNYTMAYRGYMNEGTYRTTVIVLGLFVLISGYLLGRKKIELTKPDLAAFYKKRFFRIYPPFLAAISAFAVMNITSLTSLAKSVALLSIPFGPAPHTLWFVVMLMLFYAGAPLLISLRMHTKKFMATCAGIIAALLGFHEVLQTLDVRMILYFPAFAAGIFIARSPSPGMNLPALGMAAIASLLLTINIPKNLLEVSLQSAPLALFVPLFIFSLFLNFEAKIPHVKVISAISFASFFMYLFHRPVYKLATYIYLPDSHTGQMVYLFAVCLPLVIILSWFGQRIYDILIDRIFPSAPVYTGSQHVLDARIKPIEAGTMKNPTSKRKDVNVG